MGKPLRTTAEGEIIEGPSANYRAYLEANYEISLGCRDWGTGETDSERKLEKRSLRNALKRWKSIIYERDEYLWR